MFKKGMWLCATAVALLAIIVSPTNASAAPGCFTDVAKCFESAAFLESFWYRTWEALD